MLCGGNRSEIQQKAAVTNSGRRPTSRDNSRIHTTGLYRWYYSTTSLQRYVAFLLKKV